MRWVIVGIIACLVPYTWLTLRYRKEAPAYRPYQDSMDRANVMRLLDAGFRRVEVDVSAPADAASAAVAAPHAAVTEAPGGLPPLLSETLVHIPLMPDRILQVTAPAHARSDAAYTITFESAQPNQREHLRSGELYLRNREITLIPGFETLAGELATRSARSPVRLVVPANLLEPGRYRVTLVGARESRAWHVEVE